MLSLIIGISDKSWIITAPPYQQILLQMHSSRFDHIALLRAMRQVAHALSLQSLRKLWEFNVREVMMKRIIQRSE